jgi:hypothetical protein
MYHSEGFIFKKGYIVMLFTDQEIEYHHELQLMLQLLLELVFLHFFPFPCFDIKHFNTSDCTIRFTFTKYEYASIYLVSISFELNDKYKCSRGHFFLGVEEEKRAKEERAMDE